MTEHPRRPATALFVCVENAGRSLMAEAIFSARAPAGWVAASAGTRPAAAPNPRTGPMLREKGYTLPAHPPQMLTPELARRASVTITMGCLDDSACPAYLRTPPPEDWGLPDPATLSEDGFRQVRDEIERRIDDLIQRLPTPP